MEDHHLTVRLKQEVIEAECEFVGDDPPDVHQLCTACLCATRTTRTLSDGALKQYYMHILTEMQPEGGVVLQSPRVCWECVSHLKISVRFREQVQDSYRLLQPMLSKADNEDLDECLQTSVCRPGRLKTCFAFSIDVSPQDHLMTITKHENDNDGNVKYEVCCASEDVTSPQMCNYRDDNIKQEVLNDTHTPNSTHESTGHVNTSAFVCYVCRNSFFSQSFLEQHIATHYNKTSGNSYQCDVCNKVFSRKNDLARHVSTHTDEKPYKCEECQKSFKQKRSLVNHLKTHTGENDHLKTHTGENPDYKTNKQKSKLVKQLMTHAGEKMFQCEVCPKSFILKHGLISHKRSHSDEKPFQCELCPRAFTYKQSLVAHIRVHTGERDFQCDICGKAYWNKRDFIIHFETHASEKAGEKTKKSSKNMNPNDRNQIIMLHQEGYNITSIADQMGLTRATVRLWIRRYQAEGHVRAARAQHGPRKIRGQQLQEMLAAYRADPATPTREFADRYKCSRQCVRDALHRAGVRYKSDGEASWEQAQRRK